MGEIITALMSGVSSQMGQPNVGRPSCVGGQWLKWGITQGRTKKIGVYRIYHKRVAGRAGYGGNYQETR